MKFFLIFIIFIIFVAVDFVPKYKSGKKKDYISSAILISLGFILLSFAISGANLWNPVIILNSILQQYGPF